LFSPSALLRCDRSISPGLLIPSLRRGVSWAPAKPLRKDSARSARSGSVPSCWESGRGRGAAVIEVEGARGVCAGGGDRLNLAHRDGVSRSTATATAARRIPPSAHGRRCTMLAPKSSSHRHVQPPTPPVTDAAGRRSAISGAEATVVFLRNPPCPFFGWRPAPRSR